MKKYILNEAKQLCVLGVLLFGLGHQRMLLDNDVRCINKAHMYQKRPIKENQIALPFLVFGEENVCRRGALLFDLGHLHTLDKEKATCKTLTNKKRDL